MALTIDGKRYKVVENLGYAHSAGCYAKIVAFDGGERMAVKRGGAWTWWTARDRMAAPCGPAMGQCVTGRPTPGAPAPQPGAKP